MSHGQPPALGANLLNGVVHNMAITKDNNTKKYGQSYGSCALHTALHIICKKWIKS